MLFNFLSKLSNYNIEYVRSNLASLEGFGVEQIALVNLDIYPIGLEAGVDLLADRLNACTLNGDVYSAVYVMNLEGGILNCPQPLVPNTEVKFSFERVPATFSLFYKDVKEKATTLNKSEVVPIKECYLELEYVSSPYLRNLHAQIIERPITYHYDDCQIYMKDLAKGAQAFRVNSLCGGLTPEYIFAGFMPSKCLDPDFETTSVRFANPYIRDACITLNGSPVQGYPISSLLPENTSLFYSRFLETIGKWKMTSSAGTMLIDAFKTDVMLLSHHFEGEQSNEGWIGFDVKFSKPTEQDFTFGK